MLAAVAHLFEELAKIRRENRSGTAVKAPSFVWFEENSLHILGIFAIPLTYAALLPGAGYYVLTPFFLIAELLLLGERSPLRLLAVTTGVYLATCIVFAALFYVALPVGNWPAFYAVNTWIVELLR